MSTTSSTTNHKRRWFLPDTPDVLGMLHRQAEITARGIDAFAQWAAGDTARADDVRDAEHECDERNDEENRSPVEHTASLMYERRLARRNGYAPRYRKWMPGIPPSHVHSPPLPLGDGIACGRAPVVHRDLLDQASDVPPDIGMM